MSEVSKIEMFRNRLSKMYKHRSKLARRQEISCYRVYDHDLTEFPFCIELYEDKVYLAEYLRRHGMEDEEHDVWLDECLAVIAEVTGMCRLELIYVKTEKADVATEKDQYEKDR